MKNYVLEIYRPGTVYSEGCFFQLNLDEPLQPFKTGDLLNLRSLVGITQIAEIEEENLSLKIVGVEHLVWTHNPEKTTHHIMVLTMPASRPKGSIIKVREPRNQEKHIVEIYRSDRDKVVAELHKPQAFSAFNRGDYINLRAITGSEYEVEKGVLRILALEHTLWLDEADDDLLLKCHQTKVFTEPEPDTFETRQKLFS